MKHLLIAAALMTPTALFAAGSSSSNPPTPTETTTVCEEGMVYDAETELCVVPAEGQQSGLLNDQELKDAVREFAYAGQYDAASTILSLLDANDDFTQTYLGFTARKTGDMDLAMNHYYAALSMNPDNLLVRSYMGQGYVEKGELDAAKAQLVEIIARGGADTWPAMSLEKAIMTGATHSY